MAPQRWQPRAQARVSSEEENAAPAEDAAEAAAAEGELPSVCPSNILTLTLQPAVFTVDAG